MRVLSTQITRGTEAEEGGESKDAAAVETTETLSMIVDTVVRVEAILHNREVGRMPERACCPRASNPAPAILRTWPLAQRTQITLSSMRPPRPSLPISPHPLAPSRARAPLRPTRTIASHKPPHAPTSSFSRPHTLPPLPITPHHTTPPHHHRAVRRQLPSPPT